MASAGSEPEHTPSKTAAAVESSPRRSPRFLESRCNTSLVKERLEETRMALYHLPKKQVVEVDHTNEALGEVLTRSLKRGLPATLHSRKKNWIQLPIPSKAPDDERIHVLPGFQRNGGPTPRFLILTRPITEESCEQWCKKYGWPEATWGAVKFGPPASRISKTGNRPGYGVTSYWVEPLDHQVTEFFVARQ